MLIAQIGTSIAFGGELQNQNNAEGNNDKVTGWISISCIMGFCALLLGVASLSFMLAFAESLIQITLIGSIALAFTAAVVMFVEGLVGGGCIWLGFGLISCCYAYFVWRRIPFAAATLKTGLTAVKRNLGLVTVSVGSLFVGFSWTVWWMVNYLGINSHVNEGELGDMNGGIVFLLLVCFYWGHQVISNVVHVTVAGTVGTWWFNPINANSCCSSGVTSSFKRATTFSFGSICFGSLLVAILSAIRAMVQMMRNTDDGIVICLADCILGCLESIMEYFNRWAFIYVGLYGYDFMTAGKNVIRLFKSRGWTMVINDDLVGNVLFFQALGIGALCGGLGMLANEINGEWFADEDDISVKWTIFVVGLLIGTMFSSIIFNVVQSAVDTTVVCFAEAPVDFQRNYPDLFDQMSGAWLKVYPGLWSGEEVQLNENAENSSSPTRANV
jgi:hypothetical protein